MKNHKFNWIVLILIIIMSSVAGILAIGIRGMDAVKGITYLEKPNLIDLANSPINLGIYETEPVFADNKFVAVDHYFMSWIEWDKSQISQWFSQTISRNRWPMITIEPHMDNRQSSEKPGLESIVQGNYDLLTTELCNTLNEQNQPVFIRWGHEMENVTGRYPWAVKDAQLYIDAYRHFVSLCREHLDQGYYIWSPVGHQELKKYWPGAEYVDYVGLSLFIFSEWELDYYGRVRPFSELLDERYNWIKDYQKPVIIAEMGINGDPKFQQQWLSEFFNTIAQNRYPQLKTVSYFNAKDLPEAWGPDYPIPDWRIDPEIFTQK